MLNKNLVYSNFARTMSLSFYKSFTTSQVIGWLISTSIHALLVLDADGKQFGQQYFHYVFFIGVPTTSESLAPLQKLTRVLVEFNGTQNLFGELLLLSSCSTSSLMGVNSTDHNPFF